MRWGYLVEVEGELVDDSVGNHGLAELVEVEFAVLVQIGLEDGPVHQLLDLVFVQVVAHHHFDHVVQVVLANKSVLVEVVDSEREPQLFLSMRRVGEDRKGVEELDEGNLAVFVCVDDLDDSLDDGVRTKGGDVEQVFGADFARVVFVEAFEAFV